MMTHLKRIGKAVSDQVDVILEQTCEPIEPPKAPPAPPKEEKAQGDPITKGQLAFIMDLAACRGPHGPLNLSTEVMHDLSERRAKVTKAHLEKATKEHGKPVIDVDALWKWEASALIDALKATKPNKKGAGK